ncbi:MAG: hypothetical protein FVQ81_07815 [Candidatus Glassbacteria bacterium]|nr:hypothetical protein [Candidatus Glassbacteria bacterium]
MSEDAKRILIVDDDRALSCAILRVNGFRVEEESNLLAVLKTAAEFLLHPETVASAIFNYR